MVESNSIKLLCSYGGKIFPRHQTESSVTSAATPECSPSIDPSDSQVGFQIELLVKLGEMCGSSVSLRCQLPNEDLDALVSITSDEDLANLVEEYDRANHAAGTPHPLKIRAFLSPPKSAKTVSPPPSAKSSIGDSSTIFRSNVQTFKQIPYVQNNHHHHHQYHCFQSHHHQISTAVPRASSYGGAAKLQQPYVYLHQGSPRHFCLAHDENHWQ
ncbi:hypothetical protein Syun_024224 [Stephania yunnanensis]|uniref:PB1 domain-containing protein n=1 Tax=Stephania yunnanensis TaxID=152371 RepID=A0AAP0I3Z7_9MAGN